MPKPLLVQPHPLQYMELCALLADTYCCMLQTGVWVQAPWQAVHDHLTARASPVPCLVERTATPGLTECRCVSGSRLASSVATSRTGTPWYDISSSVLFVTVRLVKSDTKIDSRTYALSPSAQVWSKSKIETLNSSSSMSSPVSCVTKRYQSATMLLRLESSVEPRRSTVKPVEVERSRNGCSVPAGSYKLARFI